MSKSVVGLAARFFWSPTTIGARSLAVDNRSTGFDYIRIVLAAAILFSHSASISYGPAVEIAIDQTIAGPFFRALVPMFFALSGYLVAASLDRCPTLISFLGLRILRICPALAVETVLSAFILGPIFTSFTLTEYFADPQFWNYLRNIYGDIHFTLPGVFGNLPSPWVVNAQLWTIKPELLCYITLSVLALVGARSQRAIIPITILVLIAGVFVLKIFFHLAAPAALGGGTWNQVGLVVVFLMGVGLHKYRENVAWSHGLAIVSGVVAYASLSFTRGTFISYLPLAYVTVYLGLLNPKKAAFLSGDYSYGLYLYGFVVQQSFAALGEWARVWWLSCLVCLPAAWILAGASWHLIEKPAQSLRPYLKALESYLMQRKWIPAI